MSLFRLALAYARRRPLATLLVVALLAIGVATIALTLLVARELEDRLTRDAAGIDLVVGAKGSPLQLVLAGIYHVDVPPGNIALSAVASLRANRLIAEAVPLALGDSLRGFRIVGTEPAFVALYGGALRKGALWDAPLEAVLGSAVAEATGLDVGATFAGAHGLAAGGGEHTDAPYRVTGILAPTGTVLDRLVVTSLDSVWIAHEGHATNAGRGFSPQAAGVHANDEHAKDEHANDEHAKGEHAKDEHAKDEHAKGEHAKGEHAKGEHARARSGAPPGAGEGAGREVTVVLVRYRTPLAAASLPRAINRDTDWVAASPAFETARLLTVFGAGMDLVRVFALVLVAASTLMLFVALAQGFEERRYDLAILRTLGASRWRVAGVLLIESVLLAAVGTLLGLALAHMAAIALGALHPEAASLALAGRRWTPGEGWVVALALGAGILAALWPAWRAARLDVAATLADT